MIDSAKSRKGELCRRMSLHVVAKSLKVKEHYSMNPQWRIATNALRRGCRLAWSRLVDSGSIDPGSNPGSPTKGTIAWLEAEQLKPWQSKRFSSFLLLMFLVAEPLDNIKDRYKRGLS